MNLSVGSVGDETFQTVFNFELNALNRSLMRCFYYSGYLRGSKVETHFYHGIVA